jgi:hypothetical protein
MECSLNIEAEQSYAWVMLKGHGRGEERQGWSRFRRFLCYLQRMHKLSGQDNDVVTEEENKKFIVFQKTRCVRYFL